MGAHRSVTAGDLEEAIGAVIGILRSVTGPD